MQRSKQKVQNTKSKGEVSQPEQICISYDQFDLLLSTLGVEEARQLEEVVKNHGLIQHRPRERYFKGKNSIMGQIRYLIDTYTQDITFLESNLSMDQNQSGLISNTKQITFSSGITVTANNYSSLVEGIRLVTCLPSNRFDIVFSQKEMIGNREQNEGNIPLLISNRCIGNKRIYMIFEKPHEIVQLMTLIDEELQLNSLKEIIPNLPKNNNMARVNIGNDKQLYFFMKNSDPDRVSQDWLKFIKHINRQFGSDDALLMHYSHFQELLKHRGDFSKHIRVVFDQDQIRLRAEQISQLKVYENTYESMNSLTQLALKVVSKCVPHLRYQKVDLDPITCFCCSLLQERQVDEVFLIERSPQSKKIYVYFTFYRKLMQVQRDPTSKTAFLTQRKLNQEITNKFYLKGIQRAKKWAVINQLPFFLLYQEASQVLTISRAQLQQLHPGDISRLLAYQYLFNRKKYKVVLSEDQGEEAIQKYQSNAVITFSSKSQVYLKMGKTKSDFILKKERIEEDNRKKGRIQAYQHFGKLFIQKCLQDLCPGC